MPHSNHKTIEKKDCKGTFVRVTGEFTKTVAVAGSNPINLGR